MQGYDYCASGPLRVVVRVLPQNGDEIHLRCDCVAVFGDEERVANRLSDVAWFHEDVSQVGLDRLLGLEEDQAAGLWLFAGHMFGERTNSVDYGIDYDGGFEVENVGELIDDPGIVAHMLTHHGVWLPAEVLGIVTHLLGEGSGFHRERLRGLRGALEVVLDALETKLYAGLAAPEQIKSDP